MQSLESVPTWFADFLGTSEAVAQILLSLVVFLTVLLPILFLSEVKTNIALSVAAFMALALLVGLGWLPFWMMIATLGVMAMTIAFFGRKAVTGGG